MLIEETPDGTVNPKKYAHGFVVLCFVVVMQSFIMNSREVFIHIHQGCFAGTGAIVRLPQCQWSKPDGYGKNSQCITTTKHSKAKTVCIFLGMYCISLVMRYDTCGPFLPHMYGNNVMYHAAHQTQQVIKTYVAVHFKYLVTIVTWRSPGRSRGRCSHMVPTSQRRVETAREIEEVYPIIMTS